MRVIDIINRAAADRAPRFTIELLPPLKGQGAGAAFTAIDPLMDYGLAYVSITCHREQVRYVEQPDGLLERRVVRHRPGTVGIAAAIIARYGIEAVPHMICAGHSRYDIEDALIDLDFLGIDNVLALRGDNLSGQNMFHPHPGGHSHADELVAQIAAMNRGRFLDGEAKDNHISAFCVGVAGYPEKHAEAPNLSADLQHLKAKVDAGADYIITQMSFDNRRIFGFIDACRAAGITVPVIPGIKPLSTREQLTVLPRVFHVDLPEELVEEALGCRDNRAVRELGIRWATAQALELKKAGIPVIHFYSMGKTDNVAAIAKAVF